MSGVVIRRSAALKLRPSLPTNRDAMSPSLHAATDGRAPGDSHAAGLPSVSVVMPAYNYERYVRRAIESALQQDYPAELLDVVVVDDGSTDDTAAVVRELIVKHPGRIRLVQQANAGATAAINRAMAEATGDLLALLDADDVWLPHKTRRQVELLQARPSLGLVFSDMVVVDGAETPLRPSLIGQLGALPSRAFARILFANVATQSSIMIRGSLRELFHPIPQEIPYSDWWVTLRAAQATEIDYIREPLALYREHGANLTGGVSGAAGVREHRKEVTFQLWALRHLDLSTLAPDELPFVWSGVEEHARAVLSSGGSFFVPPTEIGPDQIAEADDRLAEAAAARDRGDIRGEATLTLRALAWDPGRVGAVDRLNDAVARARAALEAPDPLVGARDFVVLVDAEELLDGGKMLESYVEAMNGSELVTLAIDATRLEPEQASRDLQELAERCGLDDRPEIDLIAVVGERDADQLHRLRSAAHALYRRDAEPVPDDRPAFTESSLPRLRQFAQTALLLGWDAALGSLS